MSQATRVAIAGASGYAGGELLRLVSQHPGLTLTSAMAGSHAGKPIGVLHPQLPELADQLFEPFDASHCNAADVLFLALPHGESGRIAADLSDDLIVVDLGADFRLADEAAWDKYYGGTHAGSWVYGLPEFPGGRAAIEGQRRIANPGCYPTSIVLSLWPLLADGLVEPEDLVVVAASGTSGAGRKPDLSLLATEVAGSMRPYKVGGVHQHTPEIEQVLTGISGQQVTMSFTPVLAPMPRGILATSTARVRAGVTGADLDGALNKAYQDEPFVHVLADDRWPTTGATLGSNAVHLHAALDEHAGRVVVCAALDNLVKGAAGQAIQNANLALGWNDALGLSAIGVAP